MSKFYIVFLGKRGGASILVLDLLQKRQTELQESSLILSQHFTNDAISRFQVNRFNVRTPQRISAVQFFLYFKDLKSLLKRLDSSLDGSTAYFVQSSPWDLLLKFLMKNSGAHIISGIHEVRHHRGDNWPTWLSTKIDILLSNELVFWSQYVSEKVRTSKKRVVEKLPSPITSPEKLEVNGEEYVLGIGRIRKYKGFENLASAFKSDILKNEKLMIAGEGKLNLITSGNISVINRWLSDDEIIQILGKSKLVVFPYQEASQSGIVPLAIHLKKTILYANVGGLSEQLENYDKAFVINSLEPRLLAIQIGSLVTQ
jgi:glycosyltransferase involved in cell wall biosynthesis